MKEILILVGGALLGYVGKYLEELYRRTAIRTELLRKAYTSWFSTEASIYIRVSNVFTKLGRGDYDVPAQEAALVEISALSADVAVLIHSVNEVFLAEPNKVVRGSLASLHDNLVREVAMLQQVIRVYPGTLAAQSSFESLRERKKNLPLETVAEREEIEVQFAAIEKQVADAVKSVVGNSEDLLGLNRDIHASVLRVREQVASRLAK